jgi:HK97 gp10 family phage protein
MKVDLQGSKELKRKLEAMARETSGAVMEPIIKQAADEVKQRAQAKAPVLTGKLKADITSELMKSGKGYCKYRIYLPNAFYGWFHEFGLGTKRSTAISAKTQRRQSRYQAKVAAAKEKGKKYKGSRRGRSINLAERPFIRPAIWTQTVRLKKWIIETLADRVLSAGQS